MILLLKKIKLKSVPAGDDYMTIFKNTPRADNYRQ